ncbi:MAG: carboxypeptidase-like regulatory domain-containing protein, partial [Arachidicoccus sp.]|nr:carboxypeptidase-like regulatory domain-containing protein [Arachidicoccus sp.]
MKLTFFLLTTFFMQVHATGFGQFVTLKGKNLSIQEVFKTIRRQTGYVVFANEKILQYAKPVTIHAEQEPLTEFLDKLIKGQPFNYQIDAQTIILSLKQKPLASAQLKKQPYISDSIIFMPIKTVQGKVTDSSGNPLAGVSLLIKGTKRGTITDEDGNFSLNVTDSNSVLVISLIGYRTKEVMINDDKFITVHLTQEIHELDQTDIVVSTGYQ